MPGRRRVESGSYGLALAPGPCRPGLAPSPLGRGQPAPGRSSPSRSSPSPPRRDLAVFLGSPINIGKGGHLQAPSLPSKQPMLCLGSQPNWARVLAVLPCGAGPLAWGGPLGRPRFGPRRSRRGNCPRPARRADFGPYLVNPIRYPLPRVPDPLPRAHDGAAHPSDDDRGEAQRPGPQ